MTGTLMIVAGAILTIGSVITGYYVISQGCALEGASGCEASTARLISDLMIADTGIFFWMAWVIGVFLIWGGIRLRGR